MPSATLTITSDDPAGPKQITLTSQVGNSEQSCPDGYAGDPVPENTVFRNTLALANAAAANQLDCAPLSIDLSVNGRVWDLVSDGAGGIVFVGEFSIVGGQSRNSVALYTAAGTISTTFNPNCNGTVHWILRLASGKYLIGGTFTTVSGTTRNRIARLNADGSLDSSYDPNANQAVAAAFEQSDNKVVVCGGFSTIAGASRAGLARLNADGTIDTSYNPAPDNTVAGVSPYPGDRALVWGAFATIAGVSKSGMAVLNSDGTNYTTFANTVTGQNLMRKGAYAASDGSVYVAGGFNITYSDSEHTFKLNPNGSHATGFVVDHGSTKNSNSVAVDGSGNVLIAGTFNAHNGATRNNISRCNPTTGVNDSFNPDANFDVYVIVPEAGGTYLVGGNYTTMGGISRQRFTRLNSDGTLA